MVGLARRSAAYFLSRLLCCFGQRLDYRETFQVFRPGFDLTVERRRREAAGHPEWFGEDDLYSDVRPALKELREGGYRLGWQATRRSMPARSCAASTCQSTWL